MSLFYHDVGLENAERDFPKTVFRDVPLEQVGNNAPCHLRTEMVETLKEQFPSEMMNCWGVPEGASKVVNRLSAGDAVLLIRTTAKGGDIPALCPVKAYWKHKMVDLSEALWGNERYPFIFFFNTERVSLTWVKLKEHLDYAPGFWLKGNFNSVGSSRLESYGGTRGYIDHLRREHKPTYSPPDDPKQVSEPTPEDNYQEGKRLTRERSYFRRNTRLVEAAKREHGYACQACGFDFSEKYGKLGKRYIECHHLNPLSEQSEHIENVNTTLEDVTVLCSNCHRMIHRHTPALSLKELKSAIREG